MHLDTVIHLRHLKTVQPDGSDPFAWVYYFTLDGNTIQQLTTGPNRDPLPNFKSNITIYASPGSHGNIGNPSTVRGTALPATMNSYQASLRPIEIMHDGQRRFIPGRICCFFILLEEDATADSDIETAHQKLNAFIENALNNFVATEINIDSIAARARDIVMGDLSLSPETAALRALDERITEFETRLTDQAEAVVQATVLYESFPFGSFINLFAGDYLLGTHNLKVDEETLINSNLSMSQVGVVRRSPTDLTSWYDLGIDVTGKLVPGSSDIRITSRVHSSTVINSGTFIMAGNELCVEAGDPVPWDLHALHEQWDFTFGYPFIDVIWMIEGYEVAPDAQAGERQLSREVSWPQTDALGKALKILRKAETRIVTLRFEQQRINGVSRLGLLNDPNDGTYNVAVQLVGVLPSGLRIPIDTANAIFDGQRLVLDEDALDRYNECIDRYDLGPRYKRWTIQDLFGPTRHQLQYEEVVRRINAIPPKRQLTEAQTQRVLQQVAEELGTDTLP